MKKFSEIIYNNKSLEDILCEHFKISYHMISYSLNHVILEDAGLYKNISQIIKYILDEIKKNPTSKTYIINDFNNFFIDEIKIEFIEEDYDDVKSTIPIFLNDKKHLDSIYIKLYVIRKNLVTYSIIKELLIHEIQHAWEKYNRMLKNTNTRSDEIFFKSELYDKISNFKDGENVGARFVRQVLYLMTGYERNSFISQIYAEIMDEEIDSPNELLKRLKTSNIYNKFIYFNNWVYAYYDNVLTDELIDNIVNEYNFIYKTDKNEKEVFKHLSKICDKSINQLEKILPKMCVKKLNEKFIKESKGWSIELT